MQGFPNGVNLWGENYKISILGAKPCGEAWGAQVNFLGNGGIQKKKTLEVIQE